VTAECVRSEVPMCTNNNTANMEHQMLGLAKLDANGNTLIPDICV